MLQSKILGTGFYVPPRVVTNFDLEKLMDTSDQWIQERTGIVERRFVDEGVGVADLALEASKQALERAGIGPQDLDFIILATLSPDYTFPGSAVLLQDKLGADTIGALDVRNQCSGFIYSLSIADQYIKTGCFKRILVVGSETHSTGVDLSTPGRDVAVLFGDGAGAVVVGPTEEEGKGVLSTHLHSEGKYAKELWVEAPGSIYHPRITHEMIDEGRHFPKMKGRMVFRHAVARFPEAINEALKANNYQLSDIDVLILHQANLRIIEYVAQSLEVPEHKVYNNIQRYGNTTAASIPIAIDEALQEGKIKEGSLVLLASFGSGFTWASALIRW
ncbi:MAG: ketoacyl-ACP synthase III [Deltaproteobacteria bacterium]|nr:MAG: ketoacyl-ACP synthase III [Deltaproteobacteria bacterium]